MRRPEPTTFERPDKIIYLPLLGGGWVPILAQGRVCRDDGWWLDCYVGSSVASGASVMSLMTAVMLILPLLVTLGLVTLIDWYGDPVRRNLLNPAGVRWWSVFQWLWWVSLLLCVLPARLMLQDAYPDGPPLAVVVLLAFGISSVVALALLAFAWFYTLLAGALARVIELAMRRIMPTPPS